MKAVYSMYFCFTPTIAAIIIDIALFYGSSRRLPSAVANTAAVAECCICCEVTGSCRQAEAAQFPVIAGICAVIVLLVAWRSCQRWSTPIT